jgi:serpin B
MNTYVNTWYFENKYAQVIDIPYANEDYTLTIILPKSYKKLKQVEKKLSIDCYNDYLSNKVEKRINLWLPKFSIESEFELNKTLIELGIKEAFTESANFSGITDKEKLYISNIIHKANISVDEEGTEASAATAVIMSKTSVLLEVEEIKVNRPFVYLLRNTDNNCIYFIGKISNPNK